MLFTLQKKGTISYTWLRYSCVDDSDQDSHIFMTKKKRGLFKGNLMSNFTYLYREQLLLDTSKHLFYIEKK